MAYEDMVDILKHYKKYVPCKTVILSEPIPGTDCTEDKEYVHTLIGGDYLFVARARGAQHIRRHLSWKFIGLMVCYQLQRTGMPKCVY